MKFEAQAPSNIALIKYMGKTDTNENHPCNASLSYTLKNLNSTVQIELIHDQSLLETKWEPLIGFNFELNEKAQVRFIRHFESLCKQFGISGRYVLRSANNFPAACGLASSASSFAALTKAAGLLLREVKGVALSNEKMSQLSQKGSGSSCRSFFDEWALWKDLGAIPLELPFTDLFHDVITVDTGVKEISSSEAHKRVISSLNFVGRPERANKRLDVLIKTFQDKNWQSAYETVWAEFWDMHSLFETSQPSFGYITEKSVKALNLCRDFWRREEDGPLVTMDAGPNVHLLWRNDQIQKRIRLREMMQSRGLKLWCTDLKDHH